MKGEAPAANFVSGLQAAVTSGRVARGKSFTTTPSKGWAAFSQGRRSSIYTVAGVEIRGHPHQFSYAGAHKPMLAAIGISCGARFKKGLREG